MRASEWDRDDPGLEVILGVQGPAHGVIPVNESLALSKLSPCVQSSQERMELWLWQRPKTAEH